jgi:hypothetical protein
MALWGSSEPVTTTSTLPPEGTTPEPLPPEMPEKTTTSREPAEDEEAA